MSKYDITRRLRAAVDRSEDPHLLLDMQNEELETMTARIDTLERELRAVKNTLRGEWTETGIWAVVKARLNVQAVRYGSKLVHWVVGLGGLGIVSLLGLLFKLAWRGLHT